MRSSPQHPSPVVAQYPKTKSSFFNGSKHSGSSTSSNSINSQLSGNGSNTTSNTSNGRDGGSTPRTKEVSTLDLKGSSPPGGGNAKNLSHVPCKFFKQGMCQAGNSCPFSHNLDGSLAADKLPCKYFQKGNCKFGLKCALAHFLPDGTRINSKVYRNSQGQNHGNHNGHNGHGSGHSNGQSQGQSQLFSNSSYSNGTIQTNNGGNLNGSQSNGYSSQTPQFSHSGLPKEFSMDYRSLGQDSNYYPSYPFDPLGEFPQTPINQTNSSNARLGSQSAQSGQSLSQSPFTEPIDISNRTTSSSSFSVSPASKLARFIGPGGGTTGGNPLTTMSYGPISQLSPIGSARRTSSGSYNSFGSPFGESFNGLANLDRSLDGHGQGQINGNTNGNSHHFGFSSGNMSTNGVSNSTKPLLRSYSASATPYPTIFSSSPMTTPSSYQTKMTLAPYSTSAIVDDEDDELATGDSFFEEDYVPSSLSDLILNPQELQRRDSRSQSGTLLVRPNFSTLFDKSEGETRPTLTTPNKDSTGHSHGHDDVFLME
ncbi:hypothetical protein CAAN1_05S03356 [[Candida] anglica]|uniref:C3H1-type domain-containing protein n=1 Tax=[Candida] anglica TaxID=148631 RepID=A0ABP0ED04_9ASCO